MCSVVFGGPPKKSRATKCPARCWESDGRRSMGPTTQLGQMTTRLSSGVNCIISYTFEVHSTCQWFISQSIYIYIYTCIHLHIHIHIYTLLYVYVLIYCILYTTSVTPKHLDSRWFKSWPPAPRNSGIRSYTTTPPLQTSAFAEPSLRTSAVVVTWALTGECLESMASARLWGSSENRGSLHFQWIIVD